MFLEGAAEHDGARMKTQYKGHVITTEIFAGPEGGWIVSLGVVGPDGAPVVTGVNFGSELVFATSALADRAGVLLAKYWIDQRGEPRPEAP